MTIKEETKKMSKSTSTIRVKAHDVITLNEVKGESETGLQIQIEYTKENFIELLSTIDLLHTLNMKTFDFIDQFRIDKDYEKLAKDPELLESMIVQIYNQYFDMNDKLHNIFKDMSLSQKVLH